MAKTPVGEERMAPSDYSIALKQLSTLESFQYVEGNLKDPPFSMPQDKMRSAGIDPDLWYGLGIVGVWSAIDAFGERRKPERKNGGLQRFKIDVATDQQ